MVGPTATAATVQLHELSALVEIGPEFSRFSGNRVDGVRLARTFGDLEQADAHHIVVLDPVLIDAVGSYRFDLALGALQRPVAAVLGGSPSPTGVRAALSNGVALGTLAAGTDFSSLLLTVRDLQRGRQEQDVSVLESVCRACDDTHEPAELDTLLNRAAELLGTPFEIRSDPRDDLGEPIRLVGAPTRHLVEIGQMPVDSSLRRAARSYLARCIERLLQAELDAQPPGVVAADDLVNEILLDEGDNSSAVRRLRRTGFPVDGTHTAIRIDCHDPGIDDGSPMTNRNRRLIRDAVLAATSAERGDWTCTGTPASILLVASRSGPAEATSPLDIAGAAQRVVDAVDRLGARVHVGVGTSQTGVHGLRSTVTEATIALRSAMDNQSRNEPHYFDRLGLGRALMQWAEIDWVRPVVEKALAPLLAQPERRRRESLLTLRTYLDTGRSIGETARRLHLHRNSVRYRVGRIQDLLDIDLDDPDQRLFIELGCRLFLANDQRAAG